MLMAICYQYIIQNILHVFSFLNNHYQLIFYSLKLSMNFEANYLTNPKENHTYAQENNTNARIKTWNDQLTADENSHKRFKRSQSKSFRHINNTSYPNQNNQGGSFRVKKNVNITKLEDNDYSCNYQTAKQATSDYPYIWREKSLTQPVYYQKTPTNNNTFFNQQHKIASADNSSRIDCNPFQRTASQIYPMRFISHNLYGGHVQNYQAKEKDNDKNYNCVRKQDPFKRDVSIKIDTKNYNQVLRGKQVDENKNILNLTEQNRYKSYTNLSTQSSINTNQNKYTQKITVSSQTQNKKSTSIAVNTVLNKNNSIKTQTDETNNSVQKLIQGLKYKIQSLQNQNKKLKNETLTLNKQKQQLKKLMSEKKQTLPQKMSGNKTISFVKSKDKLQITNNPRQKVLSRDNSLQSLVQGLKQQITALKQGYGLHKIEQILQSVKRQNVVLSNQLQTISLKCRILEQQNGQFVAAEQQNRRLKMQMKYLRAGMKDYKTELQRLKIQNQRLRDNNPVKKQGVGMEHSKVFTNWGSQTDSLCLSISFAGE